uniref:Uncharacterized protein n=1 Tax=Arundo donax TaxID=35708 RepID=A0A0A9GVF6_ARUDO
MLDGNPKSDTLMWNIIYSHLTTQARYVFLVLWLCPLGISKL